MKLPGQKKGEALLLEGILTTVEREDPPLSKNSILESVFLKNRFKFMLLFVRQNRIFFSVT